MITTKKYPLLLILLLIGWSLISFATPPAREELPDSVIAYITFPAGRSPDSDGKFEIEVYCKARFDIESIEIVIGHSEEITFDKQLPSFNGKMKAGNTKCWRINGVIKENRNIEDITVPVSIILAVEYLFPYRETLKRIEERYDSSMIDRMYSRRLDELKGRTLNIIRALPVLKPES